ncbi:MAG: ECF-type sigma factor [Acidobacteriota bacterium]
MDDEISAAPDARIPGAGGANRGVTRSEDQEALDFLFSVTYEELRRLASAVRQRDPGATLSPTTLVNEAWLKLSKSPAVGRSSALHFKRIAARAMRQVLITAARRRTAYKRSAVLIALDDFPAPALACDKQLLALDAALDELALMNPRQALLVESRFFGGFEVGEIATLLGISEATALRDWRAARAWLARQLGAAKVGTAHGL